MEAPLSLPPFSVMLSQGMPVAPVPVFIGALSQAVRWLLSPLKGIDVTSCLEVGGGFKFNMK